MAMITVRNILDAVHRALRVQAAQHGRSTEAEVPRNLGEGNEARKRLEARVAYHLHCP